MHIVRFRAVGCKEPKAKIVADAHPRSPRILQGALLKLHPQPWMCFPRGGCMPPAQCIRPLNPYNQSSSFTNFINLFLMQCVFARVMVRCVSHPTRRGVVGARISDRMAVVRTIRGSCHPPRVLAFRSVQCGFRDCHCFSQSVAVRSANA